MYSFGIVLLEAITGRDPVDYSRPADEVYTIFILQLHHILSPVMCRLDIMEVKIVSRSYLSNIVRLQNYLLSMTTPFTQTTEVHISFVQNCKEQTLLCSPKLFLNGRIHNFLEF